MDRSEGFFYVADCDGDWVSIVCNVDFFWGGFFLYVVVGVLVQIQGNMHGLFTVVF